MLQKLLEVTGELNRASVMIRYFNIKEKNHLGYTRLNNAIN